MLCKFFIVLYCIVTYWRHVDRVQERWNAVSEGSKVDVLNKNAESPLHLAIRMMHADIVQLLVSYGN